MIIENIRMAFKSILVNKLRSGLTILGIVIGISSVIAMLAIGQGAKKYISSNIEQMGTNLLIVHAGGAMHGMVRSEETVPLTLDDSNALKNRLQAFALIAPEVTLRGQVKYKNINTNTTLIGISSDYFKARNYKVELGSAFLAHQDNSAEKICIIGHTTLDTLSPSGESLLGKTIRVNRQPFKVIGVYAPKGAGMGGWRDEDDQILIPIQTALKRFRGNDTIQTLYVSVINKADTSFVQDETETVLRKQHQLGQDKENNFNIRSQLELLETMNNITRAFTILLGSIALISLLVGGIGIMNILLVSVTERTKEIGIRKAIGAYESDILVQFLVESIMLCGIGGVIGILLGMGVSQIIGIFSQWKPFITSWSIFVSLGVSFSVGVFFGYYPARQAAKMNPIEALRYE